MEKPITLKIKETKQNLVKALNESELPLFILEPILKDIYMETKAENLKQAQTDEYLYLKEIKGDADENNKNSSSGH
jgi:hypothetical protein